MARCKKALWQNAQHMLSSKMLVVAHLTAHPCLQKEFCEQFDAVAAANAGKPVMLTGARHLV